MSSDLTDDEVDNICAGLRQNHAKVKFLQGLGLTVRQKPNGRPLINRAHYEAVTAPPEDREPKLYMLRMKPLKQKQFEDSALARWQEAQRIAKAERGTIVGPSKAELAREKKAIIKWGKDRRAALIRFHAARRRVAKLRRTPAWANQEAIRAIYDLAHRLTDETGVPHHVDHEIPLQGELVSGLHVENNLRVIPATENIRKRNKFEVSP